MIRFRETEKASCIQRISSHCDELLTVLVMNRPVIAISLVKMPKRPAAFA